MATIKYERVSSTPSGTSGSQESVVDGYSANGRYLLFESLGDDLVAGDTNNSADVFLKDLVTGTITRVSTDSAGAQITTRAGLSNGPLAAISPDGTKIAFVSSAPELGATGGFSQLYVKDLTTGQVTLASPGVNGGNSAGSIGFLAFSPDGHKLIFDSAAPDLVAGDTNGTSDVFMRDLTTGVVTRISTGSNGEQLGQAVSGQTSNNTVTNINAFSPDGTKVLFEADVSGVSADTNNQTDVYMKDLTTGALTLVSTTATGAAGNARSYRGGFSPDGGQVTFVSFASNFVSGDTSNTADIFVKTLATGAITRASVTATGAPPTDSSNLQGFGARTPAFSPDGRHVVFISAANNLVPNDTNNVIDVFVKDLSTGAVIRVGPVEAPGATTSTITTVAGAQFSPDGKHIAFNSQDPALVPGDVNAVNTGTGGYDVFVATLPTMIQWNGAAVAGDDSSADLNTPVTGTYSNQTSTSYTLTGSAGVISYSVKGYGLTYDGAGKPVSGTVSDIVYHYIPANVDLFWLDFLAMDVAQYNAAVASGDARAVNAVTFMGDDVFVGTSRNDTLWTFAGDDNITGGGGNDSIDGGDGTDLAIYSGARADYTIARGATAGTLTITDTRSGSPDGVDTVVNVERLQFSDYSKLALISLGSDVGGEGRTDLIFRNASTGDLIDWNGAQSSTGVFLGGVSTSAYELKIADFDGDGRADLLFRNRTNGTLVIWNHGSGAASSSPGAVGTNWEIFTPDLNGDGKADLLFRDTVSGTLAVWTNGNAAQNYTIGALGSQWRIFTGDLDGDGKTDLVFRNTQDGTFVQWSGGDPNRSSFLGTLGSQWTIVSANADFDGNGKSDILFENSSTGDLVVWGDGRSTTARYLGTVATTTELVTGDWNGDGVSDLLLRDPSSGQITIWDGGLAYTAHGAGAVGTSYLLLG